MDFKKGVAMLTKTTDQVLFQVMSDDMFLLSEIASQNGWTDVERFWQGEMINTPIDVNGWKLIPADQYEHSIPAEAVERVLLLVNSGVQIQGIVIADDLRIHQVQKIQPEPTPIQINWDVVKAVLKVLGTIVAVIAAIVTLSSLLAILATVGMGLLVVTGIVAAVAFDPKLIVLISDGNGETVWFSLYTWYDLPPK